jgi:hypothetical protein
MSIKETISADLTQAMKAGDRLRLGVLRMVKARLIEAEVELRSRQGATAVLGDPEALAAIAAYAKQRRDSVDSYRQAGRDDLARQEEAEIEVLRAYLPKQLSREEVLALARATASACGAAGPKDMGMLMKALMPRVKGAADGKMVQDVVREVLGGP